MITSCVSWRAEYRRNALQAGGARQVHARGHGAGPRDGAAVWAGAARYVRADRGQLGLLRRCGPHLGDGQAGRGGFPHQTAARPRALRTERGRAGRALGRHPRGHQCR